MAANVDLPWKYTHYNDYRYNVVDELPAFARHELAPGSSWAPVLREIRQVMDDRGKHGAYLILTRSQQAYGELRGEMRANDMWRLATAVRRATVIGDGDHFGGGRHHVGRIIQPGGKSRSPLGQARGHQKILGARHRDDVEHEDRVLHRVVRSPEVVAVRDEELAVDVLDRTGVEDPERAEVDVPTGHHGTASMRTRCWVPVTATMYLPSGVNVIPVMFPGIVPLTVVGMPRVFVS